MLAHVGMALATGFPIKVPILLCSLAATIFKAKLDAGIPFGLDFSILKVLDARTAAGDPSSLVDEYKYNWWHDTKPPFLTEILCSLTLAKCLKIHWQFQLPMTHITT